nr:mannose-6-phosphate isomerase-like [Nerophis lumbriciformis]
MRHSIRKLRNPIQNYAWGSRTAIAGLLGNAAPSPEPQAELWMGDHPRAPSEVEDGAGWRALDVAIRETPEELVGRSEGGLPFLFKVLAAAEPLSIQAHPDASQAKAGFARDNAAGLALDAASRSYRDAHAKPEILYALEPFWVMRGFRPPDEIRQLLEAAGLTALLPSAALLDGKDPAMALEAFYRAWWHLPEPATRAVLDQLVPVAGRLHGDSAWPWVGRLARAYPGDRGLLSPLLLNVFELAPGEALFTGPGVLHAYLDGVGLELMGSSDNVLRGGLTGKHVDVDGLLDILRFAPQSVELLAAEQVDPQLQRIRSPDGRLMLDRWQPGSAGAVAEPLGGGEILLCTEGAGGLAVAGAPHRPFRRGEAFFVPASVKSYTVQGETVVFRAGAASPTALPA